MISEKKGACWGASANSGIPQGAVPMPWAPGVARAECSRQEKLLPRPTSPEKYVLSLAAAGRIIVYVLRQRLAPSRALALSRALPPSRALAPSSTE